MSRTWRKVKEQADYQRARKRLDRVDRTQVSDWANTSLWAIQEGLEHGNDPAALQQARTGAVGLLAAIDSLLDRQP